MPNADVQMTLDQAVKETLSILTGLDLSYDADSDRYHVIVRCLNKALRSVALEHEWSYYSDVLDIGTVVAGQQSVDLSPRQRLRIVADDSVRLIDSNGRTVRWAYILPRDSLHKYVGRAMLACSVTRNTIMFSRPFLTSEAGLTIQVPIMREPKMFQLPKSGMPVNTRVQGQLLDFDYPDLVIARAAYIYAQTDPVMQPRVQTLEAQYKDIMYQLIERDDRHTDSPYLNDFTVPIMGSLSGPHFPEMTHAHPHADERWV